MCIENLTFNANGTDVDFSGEFNRTWDNTTGRYMWINTRRTDLIWIYRVSESDVSGTSYNWVYKEGGRDGADRIACAPGHAEMPLFCITFVYAGTDVLSRDRLGLPEVDGGNTVFKIGQCGETSAPTAEPTMEPSNYPSLEPTARPTSTPRCPKDYIFESAEEGTSVTVACPFGWSGTEIVRECAVGGEWVSVSDDCFLTSMTVYVCIYLCKDKETKIV